MKAVSARVKHLWQRHCPLPQLLIIKLRQKEDPTLGERFTQARQAC